MPKSLANSLLGSKLLSTLATPKARASTFSGSPVISYFTDPLTGITYDLYQWLTPGNWTVTFDRAGLLDALVVGGAGGGSGPSSGGGGGGGGFIPASLQVFNRVYNITVGSGGYGSGGGPGGQGSYSRFDQYVAFGGGGGQNTNYPCGSGGGGGNGSGGGPTMLGQNGNIGGSAVGASGGAGAGGGGAGLPGGNWDSHGGWGGNGGDGILSTFTGIAYWYCGGGSGIGGTPGQGCYPNIGGGSSANNSSSSAGANGAVMLRIPR